MASDINPTQVRVPSTKILLLCSAAIGTFIGHKLYIKCTERSSNYASGTSVDYNDYTRILTAKAPGKIILTGEHAVVYGITALSASINKSTSVSIYEPKPESNLHDSQLILKLNSAQLSWNIKHLFTIYKQFNALNPDILATEYDNGNASIKPHITFIRALHLCKNDVLLSQTNWDKPITLAVLSLLFKTQFIDLFDNSQFMTSGVFMDVTSDIPIGVGMGSSAAWSTSLSAAVYYYYHYVTTHQKKSIDSDSMNEICNLSYDLEKINHGTPSGIDNTTSLYGGYIKYINKTNFKVMDMNSQFVHQMPLLIINTNVIGNTKSLVQNVRKLHQRYPSVLNPIFESIKHIVETVVDNVTNEAVTKQVLSENINELFAINHALLLSIGVGHKAIHRLQSICNEYGFENGFKITGAGGGGCCIVPLLSIYAAANADEMIEKFRKVLLRNGYTSYLLQTGQPGLSCKFD